MSLVLIPSKVDMWYSKRSLFKVKGWYGKDLVGLTRKIDMSEIKTALLGT